jgi:phosphotriesterase-related protein
MPSVQTVLGPVDAESLGFTLSHEHIMNMTMMRYLPYLFDWEDSVRRARRLLSLARQGGIDSIIDLTTPDLGREVGLIRAASEASGVHVVVATGWWRVIPSLFWARDPDWIARFMFHEVEHGIDDTGVKPGVIKLAQDVEHLDENGRLTDRAERVVRAAARVCRETGVPISTHHWAPREVGRLQVEVFLDEGVPMHLVCIGHSADTTDVRYLEDLLETGCYLSMDRYPGGGERPDWRARNATVKRLVERGWAGRLMLGHDYPPPPSFAGEPSPQDPEPVRYTFVKDVAIPALLQDGVTPEQVRWMTVEAPKRFLTGVEPLPRQASHEGPSN